MDNLGSLLELWTKEKDIERLLSAGFLNELQATQTYLNTLSKEKQEETISILNDIESALKEYIADIEKHKADIKSQLSATEKSAKACLSYGSSIDIQNKGKKE